MSIKTLLLVGTGSFIGGIFRYLITQFVQAKFLSTFPVGTLTVNIIGCFFIGLIFGLTGKINLNQEWRLFIAIGLLGGFTTFSAFSNETFCLFRDGQFLSATAYILASVLLGLAAIYTGNITTKFI